MVTGLTPCSGTSSHDGDSPSLALTTAAREPKTTRPAARVAERVCGRSCVCVCGRVYSSHMINGTGFIFSFVHRPRIIFCCPLTLLCCDTQYTSAQLRHKFHTPWYIVRSVVQPSWLPRLGEETALFWVWARAVPFVRASWNWGSVSVLVRVPGWFCLVRLARSRFLRPFPSRHQRCLGVLQRGGGYGHLSTRPFEFALGA